MNRLSSVAILAIGAMLLAGPAWDKAGDHKGATEHFKTAYELGKDNPEIQNSSILRAHLKMK